MILLGTLPALLLATGAQAAPPVPFGEEWESPPEMSTIGTEPHGTATIARSEFTVQTKDSTFYVYTVGAQGMEAGDFIRVEDPWGHGVRWSKSGALYLEEKRCQPLQEETDSASGGLVTVSTSGDAVVELSRNTEKADLHTYAYTDAYLTSGSLEPGDTITLHIGDDTDTPDCAHQFPDRAYEHFEWRAFEHIGTRGFHAVTPYPEFRVVAEREPVLLWVSGPSFVQAGSPFVLKVTVLDRLGNPIGAWGETASLEAAYGGASKVFDESSAGWLDFGLTLSTPGVHRVEVTAGEFTVLSNPIVVSEAAPAKGLFWGDLHSHHGHTYYDEHGTKIDENHVYSRDAMGHDLGCESEKMDPIEIDGANLWAELQDTCERQSVDGSYIVMLGTEWMSSYLNSGEGHHNVYFDNCTGFYGDHETVNGFDGDGGLLDVVHDYIDSTGARAVVVPHAMTSTGKDWDAWDYELRTNAEVFSEWGNTVDCPDCDTPNEIAGSIARGLSRGHRMGFFGATDNHDGFFGNPLTYKYELSGLAGFWAPGLTRQGIYDALEGRTTIATTGARIIVDFELVEGSSTVGMGSEIVARSPTFAWEVHGTDTISAITVQAVKLGEDADAPEDIDVSSPAELDDEGQFAWSAWDGSDYAVFLAVTQADGEKAWSSPIWITSDCDNAYAEDPEQYCGPDTGPDDTEDSDPDTPDDTGPDSGPDDTAEIPDSRHPCGCVAPAGGAPALLLGLMAALGAAARRRGRGAGVTMPHLRHAGR